MIRKSITFSAEPPRYPLPMPGLEFLSRTYCNDEFFEGPSTAIIKISQRHAQHLVGLMDVVRGLHELDPHVWRLFVGDYSVTWWSGDWDKVRKDRETGEDIPVPRPDPEAVAGGDGDWSTENDYVRVGVDEVSFQANPKESAHDVWTDPIPRAVLERLAQPPARRRKQVA